jgi:hypothetical protein
MGEMNVPNGSMLMQGTDISPCHNHNPTSPDWTYYKAQVGLIVCQVD